MTKVRSLFYVIFLFLGASCNLAQANWWRQFWADMDTVFNGTPPQTISNNNRKNAPAASADRAKGADSQNNASAAQNPTPYEIAQQRIQNSFGSLPLEIERDFITILTNNTNPVEGLSQCVLTYAFHVSNHSLPDFAARQIAYSMAGNARAQMTQYPQNFNLRPIIYDQLTAAIHNKYNEINHRPATPAE